jgi:hypothetical protein
VPQSPPPTTKGPRKLRYRPPGYRTFTGPPQAKTEKAWQMPYYRWLLWIPLSTIRIVDGDFCVPAWTVDTARDHPSARDNPLFEHRGPARGA